MRQQRREANSQPDGLIEGRNAVIEALRVGTPMDKIYIAKGETDKTLGHIASKARSAGIVVVEADRRKLDNMSRNQLLQRTSMMLELVNKEKDMMQQSYARDYAELTRLREQYNQLSTENTQHCEELRLIHASRGFKLLNMGYPIKKRIWKIFGKEI